MAFERFEWRLICCKVFVEGSKNHPFPSEIPRPFGKGDDWYNDMHVFIYNLDLESCPEASADLWIRHPLPFLHSSVGEKMTLSVWQD